MPLHTAIVFPLIICSSTGGFRRQRSSSLVEQPKHVRTFTPAAHSQELTERQRTLHHLSDQLLGPYLATRGHVLGGKHSSVR